MTHELEDFCRSLFEEHDTNGLLLSHFWRFVIYRARLSILYLLVHNCLRAFINSQWRAQDLIFWACCSFMICMVLVLLFSIWNHLMSMLFRSIIIEVSQRSINGMFEIWKSLYLGMSKWRGLNLVFLLIILFCRSYKVFVM